MAPIVYVVQHKGPARFDYWQGLTDSPDGEWGLPNEYHSVPEAKLALMEHRAGRSPLEYRIFKSYSERAFQAWANSPERREAIHQAETTGSNYPEDYPPDYEDQELVIHYAVGARIT